MTEAVIIFAKNLIYGDVKTRLAATLGHDVAIQVYRQLLEYTITITRNLPVDKILFYSRSIQEQDLWDDAVYIKNVQTGNDLGERMKNAFAFTFNSGYRHVAIIGTDCALLTTTIIMGAFTSLKSYDVVLGPASDGGYYLLAMNKLHYQLFHNISWSTGSVLQQTLEACKAEGLSVCLLPELPDIDNEDDLHNIRGRFKL